MSAFVEELQKALKIGDVVKTEMGMFSQEKLPGWEGKNPKTNQPISIPGKILPFFLPADSFSNEVLGDAHLTAEEIWYENFDKREAVPTPTKDLAAGEIYSQLVNELRQNGQFILPRLGTFVVREFVSDNTKKNLKKMITFSPSEDLRVFLNPLV